MKPNEGREGVEDRADLLKVPLHFMSHVKIHVFMQNKKQIMNYELYVTGVIPVL